MLGRRLTELRENLKKTQTAVAIDLNMTPSSYSLYERGKRSPDYDTLKKLASYYNVSMSYLLGETDERSFKQSLIAKEDQTPYNPGQFNIENLSSLERHLFKSYMTLDYDMRQKLVEHFKEAFDTYIEEDTTQKDIEAELARYRLELEAEKLGKTSSASGGRRRSLG